LIKDRSLGKKRYWFGQKVKVEVENRAVLLEGESLAKKILVLSKDKGVIRKR